MLTKPNIPDQQIKDCLNEQYGITANNLEFLPLGADKNTVVYEVDAQQSFYLKLRGGDFNEATGVIPKILQDYGIQNVIVPISTKQQRLWVNLGPYTAMVYPFVEGMNGFETSLIDQQWIELGKTLKGLHKIDTSSEILKTVPVETYSSAGREKVKVFLKQIDMTSYTEPSARKLVDFMKSKKVVIQSIIEQADQLGLELKNQNVEFVLCHADIHAGNVLINSSKKLYVIDWDTLVLAPKERDLMFIGGGVGGVWNQKSEQEYFYRGYGQTKVNQIALAYYRYERIVQDIAEFCTQILSTNAGGVDREQNVEFFQNQFLPNNVVKIAFQTNQNWTGLSSK